MRKPFQTLLVMTLEEMSNNQQFTYLLTSMKVTCFKYSNIQIYCYCEVDCIETPMLRLHYTVNSNYIIKL